MKPLDQQDIDISQLHRLNELVLRSLPTGVIVIVKGYRILTINATARRLLGIREAAIDQDFLHAVRGLRYGEVRSAIDRVFHERVAVTSASRGHRRLPADGLDPRPSSMVETVLPAGRLGAARASLASLRSRSNQLR